MVDEYFLINNVANTLNTDRLKVKWALFKIKGKPEQWRNAELAHYMRTGGTWPMWEAFKTTFKNSWGETNTTAKALTKLKASRWRKGMKMTLRDIITNLKMNLQLAGITDEELRKSYLQAALPDEYTTFLAITRPATFAASVTALQDYDTAKESTHYAFTPAQSRTPSDPWAMDIDALD